MLIRTTVQKILLKSMPDFCTYFLTISRASYLSYSDYYLSSFIKLQPITFPPTRNSANPQFILLTVSISSSTTTHQIMTSSDLQASRYDLTSLYSMMQAREVSYLEAKEEVDELSLVGLDQHEFQHWILHPENLHFSQLCLINQL